MVDTACEKSAVDDQHFSGYIAGGFGGEKNSRSGQFFNFAKAPHRRACQELLPPRSLVQKLRQDEATRGATIVMLTAAHGDGVEALAEEAGADLFLTKPFSPLDLLRLVDRLGDQQQI